jgi:hypothetical protein
VIGDVMERGVRGGLPLPFPRRLGHDVAMERRKALDEDGPSETKKGPTGSAPRIINPESGLTNPAFVDTTAKATGMSRTVVAEFLAARGLRRA